MYSALLIMQSFSLLGEGGACQLFWKHLGSGCSGHRKLFWCKFQFCIPTLGHGIDLLSVFFIMQMICSSTYYAILKIHRGSTVIITISERFRSGCLNIVLKQGKNCTETQYFPFIIWCMIYSHTVWSCSEQNMAYFYKTRPAFEKKKKRSNVTFKI